jgi:hypothetical protein
VRYCRTSRGATDGGYQHRFWPDDPVITLPAEEDHGLADGAFVPAGRA